MKVACPVCSYLTFDSEDGFPGSCDICPVCNWEDDPVQFKDQDFEGGANMVSLNEARQNYKLFGACDENSRSSVRPPNKDEIPKK